MLAGAEWETSEPAKPRRKHPKPNSKTAKGESRAQPPSSEGTKESFSSTTIIFFSSSPSFRVHQEIADNENIHILVRAADSACCNS